MPYVFENTETKNRFIFEDEQKPKSVLDLADIETMPEEGISMSVPKAALSIAGGAAAFPISGMAGLSRLITTGSLKEAGKTIEGIGSLPMKISEGDEEAQNLVKMALKPIEMVETAGQFYGDWVEKNWPDRDSAADMGALTKSIVEGTVFVGLPALKARLMRAIKAKDLPKVKETLERVGLEKPAEEIIKKPSPETKFLKEEFQKRFVFDDEPIKMDRIKLAQEQRQTQIEAEMTEGITEPAKPEKALKIAPGEAEAAKKPTPKKEAWEMTKKEHLGWYKEQFNKELGHVRKFDFMKDSDSASFQHKEAVEQALSEGRKVPQEVLAEYPELGKGKTEVVDLFEKARKVKTPKQKYADLKDAFTLMRDGVSRGNIERTGGEYQHIIASTYPDWFRGRGWNKKEFLNILDKAERGEKLTDKQFDKFHEFIGIAEELKKTHPDLIELSASEIKELEAGGAGKPTKKKRWEEAKPEEFDPNTFYSGIPIHKAGEAYTKLIGEPVWDKLVMKKIPKLLEKVPGGKAVNRAFMYEYRGDLKDTAKYMKSFEDMKRSQAIGREYGIDLGKRLQSVPEKSQLKIGEAIRGEDVKLSKGEATLADEAMWSMLELGKQAVDTGLLSEEAFFKNAGRYMPRLYTSKEYQSLLTKYDFKEATRLDLSRFKRRKDIPKEIREEMGEILTPGYPIAKGIATLTHDIEVARFFNGIAENPDWAMVKDSKGVIPEGWKQLPSNDKLGKLSKAHVHPEIFNDLQETIRVMNTPEKVWRKALGTWKFGKVIISPKTHVRNLMSNSVLAHLGGLPMYKQPYYLAKAAAEMKSKGKFWEMMRKEGGGQHTFTAGELKALFDQVESQMKDIKAGSLPERFGIIGNAWNKSKGTMRKAADLYEAEEQWFKLAKFIHNIEGKKMTPKTAWADAEKWLFNYAKVTRFQEKYRSKWYGAPFATFTFKALPRIAEAMIKTPWRFALPTAIIYGLEKAAQKKIGDTPEEIRAKKALRPEWQKGKMLGVPNFARVPIVDEYGREYFLNLTYILPWGDLGEAGKFGPIPGGLRPFSQPFVNEPIQQIMNYDPFWKQEIVSETEIAGKSKLGKIATDAKERGKHLAQTMLPTPVFDVAKIIDAIRQKPDYRGRLRPPAVVAADVIAGIKMYPVDYTEQITKDISKIDPNTGYLARKILSQIRSLAIKKQAVEKRGGNTKTYDEAIKKKIEQLKGLGEETKKKGELFKESGVH